MFKNGLAVTLVSALCLIASATTAGAALSAAGAPLVTAFIQHGWVYAVRSDGHTVRLTAGTNATSAVLSPDRNTVAYFTAVHNRADRGGRPYLTGVWIVGTRANPQHLVANLPGVAAGALAWSPNGRMLAYLYGRELAVWRGPGTGAAVVTQLARVPALFGVPTLAWSPDSRQIAVPLLPVSTQLPPSNLSVAVVHAPGGASRIVRVNFPASLLGSRTTALGSYPSSDQIGWSGGNLLVATAINGAGNSLTGIWKVAASGGLAHPVFGNPAAHNLRQADPALLNATHFLVSPHGSSLATDPGRRFWVSSMGGASSRFLAPRMAVGCRIAQWSWLVGGQGLAYVTLCTVGGTTSFRSTLYTVQLRNGHPQAVVTVISPKMTELSLAPTSRCMACG